MYIISQNNTRSEHDRTHNELMRDKQSDNSKINVVHFQKKNVGMFCHV